MAALVTRHTRCYGFIEQYVCDLTEAFEASFNTKSQLHSIIDSGHTVWRSQNRRVAVYFLKSEGFRVYYWGEFVNVLIKF